MCAVYGCTGELERRTFASRAWGARVAENGGKYARNGPGAIGPPLHVL
jgi:hypothetical protein